MSRGPPGCWAGARPSEDSKPPRTECPVFTPFSPKDRFSPYNRTLWQTKRDDGRGPWFPSGDWGELLNLHKPQKWREEGAAVERADYTMCPKQQARAPHVGVKHAGASPGCVMPLLHALTLSSTRPHWAPPRGLAPCSDSDAMSVHRTLGSAQKPLFRETRRGLAFSWDSPICVARGHVSTPLSLLVWWTANGQSVECWLRNGVTTVSLLQNSYASVSSFIK